MRDVHDCVSKENEPSTVAFHLYCCELHGTSTAVLPPLADWR